MAYNGMREYVELLKARKLVEIVDDPVDTELHVAEIADRFFVDTNNGENPQEYNKALLFENTSSTMPLLMNIFGSSLLTMYALSGQSPEMLQEKIVSLLNLVKPDRNGKIKRWPLAKEAFNLSRIMPRRHRNSSSGCFDVIMPIPDLMQLPIIKSWPEDAGRFITLPLVHTQDPDTGEQNMGMYRMQIFDELTTGMHWHKHKGGAAHFEKYKKLGKRMPVTVTLGGDPALIYSATAPIPPGISEFLLAGFIRNKRIDLVRCKTNSLFVPQISDIVIEGYVDPQEPFRLEGPFGDHTGFYSPADLYPVFHVTSISYRKDAIFPATIVGIPPKEDMWLGKLTESLFFPLIRQTIFEPLSDLYLPAEGGFHNLAVASIRNDYPSQSQQLMHAFWGAGQMAFTKFIVVCDGEIDIHNWEALLNLITSRFIPARDLLLSKGITDVLDHASVHFLSGGKAGFDLCSSELNRLDVLELNSSIYERYQHKVISTRLVAVYSDNISDCLSGINESINELEKESGNGIIIVFPSLCYKWEWSLQMWLALANLDPMRDFYLNTTKNEGGILLIDAGSQGKQPVPGGAWPHAVVMNNEVILSVDEWWKKRFDRFVPSPSLRVR